MYISLMKHFPTSGLYTEILQRRANLGYLKKKGGGGGAQLQVASGGTLKDNAKKLVW